MMTYPDDNAVISGLHSICNVWNFEQINPQDWQNF